MNIEEQYNELIHSLAKLKKYGSGIRYSLFKNRKENENGKWGQAKFSPPFHT